MATIDPADALQVGIYARLSSDATLVGMVTGFYDGVPESAAFPYVTIGEVTATVDGTHSAPGRAMVATLHTWTRAQSHRPGNQIGARIVALLDHLHFDLDPLVTGHKVWRIVHEFSQTLIDPEPGIRHRVDRFRIFTSQGD